ncbi:MAG TPA: ABC transporter permease [Pseudonocardia sp.]|uniref:ABC transporter permease n=1 Tax=Pseudonocardia sp. TaxID=60912 RepID=UPI002C869CF9|nr:ABC transporter permease [Pseudonocardia sp.]HTF46223.1 ABC transporter permease [Pseudonocardia sp.]
MLTLIAKRLLAAVVILVVLAAALFGLQHISKSDPVHTMLGPGASPATVAAERHRLGLDRPVATQFWHYLTGLVHGDLGTSYRTRSPVATDLRTFLPATLELAMFGLLLAIVLAVLLAVATTLRWPGASVIRYLLLLGGSTPAFFLAIGGIIVFYKYLGVLPATGRTDGAVSSGPTHLLLLDAVLHGQPGLFIDALRHLLLPSLAVAIGPAISIGRVLRSSLITTLGQDYVRTARAKGLSELKVLARHVLRNSAGPALSMTGLQVGLLFAGVLVVESIFAWPGLGQYTAQSLPVDDFPAIAGVTLLLGAGYVLINTLVDIVQALADPRIDV